MKPSKEIKQLAKDVVMTQLSMVMYRLYEGDDTKDLPEAEQKLISTEIYKIGDRIGKLLNENFWVQ